MNASTKAKRRRRTGLISLLLSAGLSVLGCDRNSGSGGTAATETALAGLKFPALWVFGESSVLPVANADGLKSLHSNYLNLNREDPKYLIDSSFRVYKVSNLHSTLSGLEQIAHPVGSMPIAFDLTLDDEGIVAARKRITACRYLGSEPEEARSAVNEKATLEGMIQTIQGTDDPRPGEMP